MNLATESWIPVLHKSGEHRLVSLRQVFLEGEEYTDLAVRTHERIALMRLLVCIAQAALDGPKDITEREKVPDLLPKAVDEYLHQGYFKLFDAKRPFLQIPDLETAGEPTPVSKLDFSLATGNATTLFDHGANQEGDRLFAPAKMALMLLTYLNFSPGGLIAQVNWGNQKTTKSSDDAPCIPSSMYHSFIRKENIRDTIYANFLTKTTVKHFYGNDKWGRPVWENAPESFSDNEAITNATATYLGRLVPLPRFVLLNPSGQTMILANGFKYPGLNIWPREPSATIVVVKVKEKDERKVLGAGNREIWRELPALIVKRKTDDLGGALTLMNVPEKEGFDLYVGALIRKQADILEAVESVYHVPSSLQTEHGRMVYESETKFAEGIASRLYWAVETYFRHLSDDWSEKIKREPDPRKRGALRKQFVAKSTNHYWTAVEKLRLLLMAYVDAIGGDADTVDKGKDTWRSAVHSAARDAYCLACGQETPRQMRAFALGWDRLFVQRSENVASDEPDAETDEQE